MLTPKYDTNKIQTPGKYTERADTNAPSLVYRLLTCVGRLRRDGQCCGREAQCDRQTKINWTKTARRTYTNTSNVCWHTQFIVMGLAYVTGPRANWFSHLGWPRKTASSIIYSMQ